MSGEWRMIGGAGHAARRAASSVSDGRSRVPGCGARGRSAQCVGVGGGCVVSCV